VNGAPNGHIRSTQIQAPQQTLLGQLAFKATQYGVNPHTIIPSASAHDYKIFAATASSASPWCGRGAQICESSDSTRLRSVRTSSPSYYTTTYYTTSYTNNSATKLSIGRSFSRHNTTSVLNPDSFCSDTLLFDEMNKNHKKTCALSPPTPNTYNAWQPLVSPVALDKLSLNWWCNAGNL